MVRIIRTALLALILCSLAFPAAGITAMGATPDIVPVDLPLTGPGSFFGQSQAQMLRLYEKVSNAQNGIHGAPVDFQILDDESSPQVAVQLVGSALANRPAVVLGGGTYGTCLAIAPLFAKGPVQYCLSPAMNPAAGSFSFAAYMSVPAIETATVRYFHEMGWRRVAIIGTTDASGEQSVTEFAHNVEANHDMSVVDIERFNPTDVSVSAQIARLKASNPHIAAFAAGAPFETMVRGLYNAGVDLPVDTSSANTTPTELAQVAAVLPTTLLTNGSVYNMRASLPRGPLKDACDELARALGNSADTPGATELFTWDVAKITVSALRALPVGASAQQLRDYLAGLHNFAGVNGMYDFRTGNQHGLTDSSVVLVRWDPQKKIMVAASQPGGLRLRP